MTDEVVTYDHGVWKYTVVICNVTREWAPKTKRGDCETLGVEWVPVDQVAGSNLHSDSKTQWPALLNTVKATKSIGVSSGSVSPGVEQKLTSAVRDTKRDTNDDTRIDRPLEEHREAGSPAPFSSAELFERRHQSILTVRRNISEMKAIARREGFRS